MPCNFSGGVGDLLSFGAKSEKSFLYSSIYTAIILTVLIILIVLLIYPCSHNATAWQKTKTFIYIFAATFFTLVVHKGTITKVLQNKQGETSSDRLIQNINGGNTVAETIVVEPSASTMAGMQQYMV